MNLDNVIFVWSENVNPNPPARPPTVSVSAWPYLFGKDWLKWKPFENVPEDTLQAVTSAKVAFVNQFYLPESIHIQQIRRANPECFIVCMPDPSLDMVLSQTKWDTLWEQMAQADMIGGRTHADCDVYGMLLNKPTVYFPSPIGPDEFFIPYRSLPKEDYLLTLDHSFAPENTACNIAAVAAIQRETGIRVIYAAARDHTRHLADLAGLKAEWPGHVGWRDFVELTAKARLCVDGYASHSYGRQNVLCAMVGTPIVGSSLCADAPGELVDLFQPLRVKDEALPYIHYGIIRVEQEFNYAEVERKFSFTASRARLLHLLERIEGERVKE